MNCIKLGDWPGLADDYTALLPRPVTIGGGVKPAPTKRNNQISHKQQSA
jgi:hypothetical protein